MKTESKEKIFVETKKPYQSHAHSCNFVKFKFILLVANRVGSSPIQRLHLYISSRKTTELGRYRHTKICSVFYNLGDTIAINYFITFFKPFCVYLFPNERNDEDYK